MPDFVAAEMDIFDEIKALLPQSIVLKNEPLARRTTLRVGGPADVYVEPASEADLASAVAWLQRHSVPFRVLGRGSNLLIRDGGVRGVVFRLFAPVFSAVELHDGILRCGAGAKLKAVSAKARECNLSGFEFLEGIPGSVGGAMRMNAGAMGSAMFEVLTRVRFMTHRGEIGECAAFDVPHEYRSSPFFLTHIALGADLRGRPSTRETIVKTTDAFNEKRWSSQPKDPSAGCIFKNPGPTLPAGRLIEELGLKGRRVGGAVVSTIHGNFIVNEGGATASDVLELISQIKARARAERGIDLHTEVEIIGEDL